MIMGGSSAGAWAPADIQQRVSGTRPEMSLGIKVSICHKEYEDFEFKFHFQSKNWVYFEWNWIFLYQHLDFLKTGTRPVKTLESPLICMGKIKTFN